MMEQKGWGLDWTLDQLNAFMAAAEHGSFSAAARVLGRAQSVVSTHIAMLEAELGLELFDRTTKTPTLTEAGADLLEEAREVLRRCRRFDARAIARYQGEAGRLTLTLGHGMPAHLANIVLARLAKKWPHVAVSLLTLTDAEAWQRVENGEAQLALAYDDNLECPQNCEAIWVASIDRVVVAAHDHPLARQERVTTSDLANYRQIIIGDSGHTSLPVAAGSACWETNDLILALDMAQRGVGWAVLPAPLVRLFTSSPPPALASFMPPPPAILSTADLQMPPANVVLLWNFQFLRRDIVDWLRKGLVEAFSSPLE